MSEAVVSLPESGARGAALRLAGDARLARLASRGSRQAFAEIYQRYHQPLYRYCLSIVRNPEDAGDALQSAMVKALHALAGEQRDIALKPWLYRIAHNESISLLRRRREHAPIDDAERMAGAPMDTDLATREQLRELISDLGELSERQRSALIMRELNGLEYDEIASVFTISPAAAKQTVYEARTALHERAEGREMDCVTIRKALSDGDRRVARGRRIRAHVHDCAGCRDFEALLRARPAQLAALTPPLPAAAAGAILSGVIGGGGGGGVGGGGLLAALGGSAATQTKLAAVGAATMVAGAGVIGVVGTPAPTRDAQEPRRDVPAIAFGDREGHGQPGAQRDQRAGTRAASGRSSQRRTGAAGRAAADRGLDHARYKQATLSPDPGSTGANPPAESDTAPESPPAMTEAPPPSDPSGRRGSHLGEAIQNAVPGTLPVPAPEVDAPQLPALPLPRRR